MYDKVVAGKPGRRTVLRDARQGMAVPRDLPSAAPVPGHDLHLTLDAALQQIAERELGEAAARYAPRAAAWCCSTRATGAVLAHGLVADLRPQPLRAPPTDESGATAR